VILRKTAEDVGVWRGSYMHPLGGSRSSFGLLRCTSGKEIPRTRKTALNRRGAVRKEEKILYGKHRWRRGSQVPREEGERHIKKPQDFNAKRAY